MQTILTDKTGTLTRNVMEFFKCSIAGVSYGQGVTEIERSNAERKGIALPPGSNAAAAAHRQPFFNFYDSRLMGPHGRGAWQEQPGADTIQMFFRLLSVCHTVIPDGSLDPSGPSGGRVKYEAESPDEQALVVAAKALGFYFHRRSNTTVTVREAAPDGSGAYKDVTYELLNTLEFNSTRKRMSVIVKAPGGRLLLFCKGADSVIYARLDPRRPDNLALKDITSRHMEEYGSAGLRTLCLAYSELDPAVYAQWQVRRRSVTNRVHAGACSAERVSVVGDTRDIRSARTHVAHHTPVAHYRTHAPLRMYCQYRLRAALLTCPPSLTHTYTCSYMPSRPTTTTTITTTTTTTAAAATGEVHGGEDEP